MDSTVGRRRVRHRGSASGKCNCRSQHWRQRTPVRGPEERRYLHNESTAAVHCGARRSARCGRTNRGRAHCIRAARCTDASLTRQGSRNPPFSRDATRHIRPHSSDIHIMQALLDIICIRIRKLRREESPSYYVSLIVFELELLY